MDVAAAAAAEQQQQPGEVYTPDDLLVWGPGVLGGYAGARARACIHVRAGLKHM